MTKDATSFEGFAAVPTTVGDLGATQFTSDSTDVWRMMTAPSDVAVTPIEITDQAAAPAMTDAVPAFADAATWPALKAAFDGAKGVEFSSAEDNAKNGVVPDFILGADGKLRPNPEAEPSPDGKINIQVEEANASEIAAAKLENENQKASAREMIAYFQKNNPGAEVPAHWRAILELEPDDIPAPPSSDTTPPPSAPAPPSYPGAGGGSSGGGGGYSGGGGGSSGGGGYSGGGGGSSGGGGYRAGGDGGGSYVPDGAPRGGDSTPLSPPIANDLRIEGPPTITPEKIEEVLREYGSPAANEPGIGQYVYDLGVETGINPAIALAFFIQESSAGTDGIATRTNSWGNIRATDPSQPQIDGFRAYGSFKEGVADWYRLIDEVYLQPQSAGGFGAETLSQVINIYAPASDGNDPAGYVSRAIQRVEAWERDTADERAAEETATV